jgi:hypothetical protein
MTATKADPSRPGMLHSSPAQGAGSLEFLASWGAVWDGSARLLPKRKPARGGLFLFLLYKFSMTFLDGFTARVFRQ